MYKSSNIVKVLLQSKENKRVSPPLCICDSILQINPKSTTDMKQDIYNSPVSKIKVDYDVNYNV